MPDTGAWLCLGSIAVLLLVVIGQQHSIHVLRRAPAQPERLLMPSDEVVQSLQASPVTRSTVVQAKALATSGALTADQLLLALADPRILGPVLNLLKGDSQMAIADKLTELTNALTALRAEEDTTKQALGVVKTNQEGMQAQIAALKQEIDEMGGLQPAIDAAMALLNDAKTNTKSAQDIATAGAPTA